MRGPGGRSAVRKYALACGLTVGALLASVHASSPVAAEGGTSCPLSLAKQIDSIHKFAPIAEFVTSEPRCFNCHGGVNPHIDGVGSDPEDSDAPASTVEHGGGAMPRAARGSGSIAGGCLECHSNMARKRDGSASNWMTAPAFRSFVGKDAPTLCKQFKRASGSADHFLGHLKDDNGGNNFGGTAFKGDRGLDPEMFDIPPAPPSISHPALMRLGQDWIDAMGGSFKGDERCGCEVRIKGKFTSTDTGELGPARDVTRVTGELVWKKKEEVGAGATSAGGETMFFTPVDGSITVEMEFENRGLDGTSVCKGSGQKTFPVASLARGALRFMELEIAGDGSYRVTLVIPDTPDPFPTWYFDTQCIFPNVTSSQPVDVRHVSVVLGKQQGVIDGQQGIVGQLETPIRRGPRTITGSWSFETQGAP